MKSIFKRHMRFTAMVLMLFMLVGLFPIGVFAASGGSGSGGQGSNDLDDVIDLIIDILSDEDNEENLAKLQECLEGIGPEQLRFLLEKTEVLINARDSIVPAATKERLLYYGVNSGSVNSFLDDVFENDGVFATDEDFQAFVDTLITLIGDKDVSFDDLRALIDYYHELDEAFTENFPDAVGAGEEKLKTYDLVALSTLFFKLFGESLDPFALTPDDKIYIKEAIDELPGSVKEKLELYGIDWAAYDNAIDTALAEGLITEDDKSVIRSILGLQGAVLAPTASPEGGTYYNEVKVQLSTLTAGAEIHYTTDGNAPTVTSKKYTEAITVAKTTTIKAMAVKNGSNSEVKTFVYTIKTAAPTATPKPGTYSKENHPFINVSLSSATPGSAIYYTKDGKTPTSGSILYSGPITVSEDTVIKAIAVKNGITSQVATFSYKFVIKVISIDDDYTVEEGIANIEIPDVPLGDDGRTQPVQAVIPVSLALSQALGIPEGSSLSITLPPLNLSGGQVSVEIKKAEDLPDELEELGDRFLAIEITVNGLEGQTVMLVLPLPEGLDADDNIGAFHFNPANDRWEYREATITDDGVMFETDLSPVAISEAVEVPEITGATPTTNSVALTWTAVADAAYYEVYRGDSKVADNITATNYTVTGLNAGTSYTLKVRAVNGNNFESDFAQIDVRTSSSPGSGGGGGGGSGSGYTISDSEVTKQLNAGNKDITVTVPAGTKTINISYQVYNKIVAAGKDLVIHTDKVSLRIPAGAFDISGTGVITLKVGELTDAASKAVVDKLDANAKLLGKVFDITSSVAPEKAVEVTLSYDGVDLSGIDEDLLDVYWYNEATGAWEAMDGRVDEGDSTIEFSTTHFSKYAVVAYEKTEEVPIFKDIANHWAKADIEFMVDKGVIKGISATEFAPNNPITRAEFAALLVRALGLEADTGYALSFTDVSKSKWYYGEVAAAFKAGIVKGASATTFAPNANITREEMAVMITRAMAEAGKETDMTDAQVQEKLAKFKDAADIASWAQADVAKAVEFGIIEGRTADTFVAKANATRAESAVMIKRMYDQIQ